GGVLNLRTVTYGPHHKFFWRLDHDEESLKLVLAEDLEGTALRLHTTEKFLYVLGVGSHFYRIPRSADFIPALSRGYSFTLRPWGADDRRGDDIQSATSCDNVFIYATKWDCEGVRGDILVGIDVENDIGRYGTIGPVGLNDVSATILNGKAAVFWLIGRHPRNAYKWTRGRGGPGSKDTCTPFLRHHGVKVTSLTVSNGVGWLGLRVQEEV
ncbi:hypothetical protein FOZ60_012777, partial [Perkinsus olseni]